MTKVRNKSLTLLTAIGMACAGCHNGSDWEPSEPDMSLSNPEMLTLNLNVNYDVNGTQTATRADLKDKDGYEPADGDFEMINSLRVIIIRDVMVTDSKASGTVEANRMVATTDAGYPIRDNLEFEVIANEKKRIYLIANERSITSTPPKSEDTETDTKTYTTATAFLNSLSIKDRVDLNQLADWTVKIPNPDDNDIVQQGLYSDVTEGITPRLPLTEWFNISTACDSTDLKNINPDNLYCTQLFITRTAAKATFIVDQENSSPAYDNVKITALTLNGIGSEEYLFPRNTTYSKPKYPEGENILQMNSPWNLPTSDGLNMYITDFTTPPESKPLTYLKTGLDVPIVNKNAGEDTKREVLGPIYFPESILATGKKYEVGVQLNTGVWLTAPLNTNILNIGGRDAVARNTHLKIILTFTPTNLEAVATVLPYTAVSLNPEFGFAAPESDMLTVAPTLELDMNDPARNALLTATFTSSVGNTIHNLYWISSNPSIVLLSNEVTDESDQRYVEPSASIELPYLQEVNAQLEPVPVRIVPKGVGTTNVTVYTQSGLVARCRVTVK